MKLPICLVSIIISLAFAQDYQDYEAPQRAAPARLGQQSGHVEQRPTPVPILKQINRHNEDGSYTYGYEGADGSFKIETKLATGEVKGKYGYVDETGKVRIVEYGANKYGFQPSGEGITVAPPTLVDETTNKDNIPDYDDEPQQQPIQQQKPYIARVARPQPQPRPAPRPQPRPQPQYVEYVQEPAPVRPQQYEPEPRHQYSVGPSPPRLQIPGAQQNNDVVYAQDSRPARPDPEYTQNQSFGIGPQQQQQQQQQQNVRISRPLYAAAPVPSARSQAFAPQVRPAEEPVYRQPAPLRTQPQHVQYAAPSAPQGRSTSVLDQLAKDYALPQNGANPLHDITFGYNF